MLHVAVLLAVLTPQAEGRLPVDGNLSARYQHVFNRNAIADARVIGDDVVALTPGGLLLRFGLPAVELEDVVYPDAPIVCLGRNADGGLLAADAEGGIYSVDVATMTLTSIAKFPSRPLAVGAYRVNPSAAESIVVVTAGEVHDLGTGRRWELDFRAHRLTIHVDRAARLWIGSDNGEWGGWVARVNLRAGELKVYSDCLTESKDRSREFSAGQFRCHGVHGFTELRNGTMWVHGGTTHLGRSSAWIARLDDAGISGLFENQGSSWGEVRRSEKPRLPIAHIVEHPTEDAVYVFSFNEVFRTDRRLSRFKLAYKLDLVKGTGASVSAVDWIGGGDELLVSTSLDGLWRLSDGRQSHHAFAGDLGASRIDRMERSNDGVVFFDDNIVWTHSAGDWSVKPLAPDAGPTFDLTELSAYASWQTELAFVDAGGDIVSVTETNLTPGPRATVRWRGDVPTLLKMEANPEGHLVSGFATPDGELWAASRRGLYRFSGSGWVHATALAMDDTVGPPRLRALATAGPPWNLFEQTSGELLRLSYEGLLTRLRSVPNGGARLDDVVRWNDGWLFATSAGLRTYDFAEKAWSNVDLAVDAGAVRVLALDGAGRLWLAGAGLWVVVGNRAVGNRVIDLASLPPLAASEVIAMIADPHRRDGVIVSLGERGLVYVATE